MHGLKLRSFFETFERVGLGDLAASLAFRENTS
jgi:hypothetical protein